MTRFDLVLAQWQRQMRRFFLVELPGTALLVALCLYVRLHLPAAALATSTLLATLACIISVFAFLCLWCTRLPPHRPAPYELDAPFEMVAE